MRCCSLIRVANETARAKVLIVISLPCRCKFVQLYFKKIQNTGRNKELGGRQDSGRYNDGERVLKSIPEIISKSYNSWFELFSEILETEKHKDICSSALCLKT